MTRAISYLRFSDAPQSRGDSIRRQLAGTTRLCEKHGWTLDESFTVRDLGVSAFRGKNISDTGGLGAFLEAIRTGRVAPGTVLVIENLDRLSRQEAGDGHELWSGILKAGVTIATIEPEEIFTPASRNDFISIIKAILNFQRAHEESATKSYRIREKWAERRLRASEEKVIATAPAWLELSEDRKSWVILEDKVKVVHQLFAWALEGLTTVTMQKLLNASVPPISRGKSWRRAYIIDILRNRACIGEAQMKSQGKPIGEPLPDYFPRIISDDTFYRCQKILSRPNGKGRKGAAVTNLFSGLLKNARDGSAVYVQRSVSQNEGVVHYLVSQKHHDKVVGADEIRMRYDHVEDAFLSLVRELKASDVVPQTKRTNADEELSVLSGRLAILDNKRAKLKVRLLGDEDEDDILDALKSIKSEMEVTTAKMEEIRMNQSSSESETLGEVQTSIDLLEDATPEEVPLLRERIRGRIRSLVQEMVIVAFDLPSPPSTYRGKPWTRCCEVQVFFKNGLSRSMFVSRNAAIGNVEPITINPLFNLHNYRDEAGGWYDSPELLEEMVQAHASRLCKQPVIVVNNMVQL